MKNITISSLEYDYLLKCKARYETLLRNQRHYANKPEVKARKAEIRRKQRKKERIGNGKI